LISHYFLLMIHKTRCEIQTKKNRRKGRRRFRKSI
jgi:hypothetical protein